MINSIFRQLVHIVSVKDGGEELDHIVLDFIAHAYSNKSFPPDKFLFDQEIHKLKFSLTGALKNNSDEL